MGAGTFEPGVFITDCPEVIAEFRIDVVEEIFGSARLEQRGARSAGGNDPFRKSVEIVLRAAELFRFS